MLLLLTAREEHEMFGFGAHHEDEGWTWRHEVALPENPPRFGEDEIALTSAWRSLVLLHTNFRATNYTEYRDLVDSLRGIELLFLNDLELSGYYNECYRPVGKPADSRNAISRAERHVAAIQGQLMEEAYFVLELARYGNALDNRGWMNLFRAWGQAENFNIVFGSLRSTFAKEFVEFYDHYLRYALGPIESYPIPHPWDVDRVRSPLDAESKIWTVAPGVYLDSGLRGTGTKDIGDTTPSSRPATGVHGVEEHTQVDLKVDDDADRDSGSSSSSPNS